MTTTLKNFVKRIKLCWKLLFGRYDHYVLLNISDDQFQTLEKYDFPLTSHVADVEVEFGGIQKYQVFQLIEYSCRHMDFAEKVLSKAEFQAKVFEKLEKDV
ncbi:hypothetical protein [Pedobacter sp. SYSU D00535]|uniref:hypothetical protein n=1 Tax=Pedobacter sp. SYSU D00535 TaxID=2810308 RepID=UPI001A979757|nr:hypothetical protein [Pedobacter sp. SYSU D00535]